MPDMKIRFSVDGGFAALPGLARPVEIDVDSLPAAQASRLRACVDRSRFFDRAEPVVVAKGKGAADLRQYVVTVEDGGRRRTLTIPESDDDADLVALVDALQEQRRSARG